MYLIYLLIFHASYYNLQFTTFHIPGILNTNADALLWNNAAMFFSQVPWAIKDPIQIPDHLVSLNQMWISAAWMMLFQVSIL